MYNDSRKHPDLEEVIWLKIDLEKQIEILKSHPDFDEVVRSAGVGLRANTLIVLLNNGNWFELEFSEWETGKIYVDYWMIAKPDALAQGLLDYLQSQQACN